MHYGARQYQRHGEQALSPQSVELAVFRETNRRMIEASDEMTRIAALNRNHRMWSAFVKDVGLSGNPLPDVLKKDLLSVGFFAMQYSTFSIATPLPIKPLLEINQQMIDALSQQVKAMTAPAPQPVAGELSRLSA